jgi:hypothetical protein
MKAKDVSRRQFLEQIGVGAVGVGVLPRLVSAQSRDFSQAPAVDKKHVIATLGDIIIPVAPGCPGYKSLEQYGITDEVLKGLLAVTQQDCNTFNAATADFFGGKSFVDLGEDKRTEFVDMIVNSFPPGGLGVARMSDISYGRESGQGSGEAGKSAGKLAPLGDNAVGVLQKVFRLTRNRVLLVFYQNFPENKIARDKNDIPILKPGDQHQILNPNTKQLVTGWDVAGFGGPLSWDEEEARRAKWMKIHWHKD